MCHRPADGHGNGRRHVSLGDLPACGRPRAMEYRLRTTEPSPDRWPLRRKPEPPAALLPVSGADEAEPGQHPGSVSTVAAATGVRPADACQNGRAACREGGGEFVLISGVAAV